MDETSKAIIDKITVRYAKPTTIVSGHRSTIFFDCIRLSPADLARLAAEATGDLPDGQFDIALGIAYTGILYASAVAGGKEVAILATDNSIFGPSVKGKRVVIVDDVVHSGGRMQSAQLAVEASGGKVVGYACIIDRSNGKFGSAATPLWSAYQAPME